MAPEVAIFRDKHHPHSCRADLRAPITNTSCSVHNRSLVKFFGGLMEELVVSLELFQVLLPSECSSSSSRVPSQS